MVAPFLALHIPDGFLNVPVSLVGWLLIVVAVWLALRQTRTHIDASQAPLLGILGAFVFAAQMINCPIPVGGTSGHLGGGVLLAILLGPHAASLVMASILIVQCLIFQDGGVLAT